MSDRFGSHPPDEPVIGANIPPAAPPPPPRPPVIGGFAAEPPAGVQGPDEEELYDAEDDYDYGDDDDGYYDDDYYEDTPARQPMFYVFIALAAIVGGIFIFLLYSIVTGGGGSGTKKSGADFKVVIDQPVQNERIETGKDLTISVRATATEPISRIELLINGSTVGQFLPPAPPPADLIYATSFTWRFNAKGEYKIQAKVTSESGGTKSSDTVTVIAFEGVGDKPVTIKGKVLASVNMRTGPGENFEAVGRLNPGDQVNVTGKTRDSEWLLIENNGQRWVPRTAIELAESLALVPVREPTPAPATPTNTATASQSPSPSPSATVNPKAPDFAPTNAVLIDGGRGLRVTVGNISSNAYNGSLVVSVSGVGPGTLTKVFNVTLPANGNTTVDFELDPPVTGQKSATVKVDPDNAIKEANEDNNSATFGLSAPVEQPDIIITGADIQPSGINVTIKNNGGALAATTVTVKVRLGGSATEKSQELALAKGQSVTFSGITKPGSGAATIEVVIGGQVVASTPLTIP